MRNRITNNCKTLRHLTLLIWLICCFIANTTRAKSLSINVYLKLTPKNHIETLIQEFNHYLAQQGIDTKYRIIPYIQHHPLHITLYLANYNSQQIPVILSRVKELVKQQNQIAFSSSEFVPERSGYVMLTVTYNKKLLELSNKVLNKLAPLRDPDALIPSWAAQDKKRQAIFNQYGSPNVFQYFNPHFSIFSAEHLNKKQSDFLYQKLYQLIHQFNQSHPKKIQENAVAIGVGVSNEQGQITKELAMFPIN